MTDTDAHVDQQTPPKRPVGKPRTRSPVALTAEQLTQMDEWARAQAKDQWIADMLGWDEETLKKQYRRRLKQKRCEGKLTVLQAQLRGALAREGASAATERIWWGKQYLDQTDRAREDVRMSGDVSIITFGSRPGKPTGKQGKQAHAGAEAEAGAKHG